MLEPRWRPVQVALLTLQHLFNALPMSSDVRRLPANARSFNALVSYKYPLPVFTSLSLLSRTLALSLLFRTLAHSLRIFYSMFLCFSHSPLDHPPVSLIVTFFVTGFVPPLLPLLLRAVLHPPSPVTTTCRRRSSPGNPKFTVFLFYVSCCLFRSRLSTFNLLSYMC